MGTNSSAKKQAFLEGLTLERAALQYRATQYYKANDMTKMLDAFAMLEKIDAEIQKLVGCSCPETGGGAECGQMMFDDDGNVTSGEMCSCECHDRIMARLPEHLKPSVDDFTFSFVYTALLRIFRDDWNL